MMNASCSCQNQNITYNSPNKESIAHLIFLCLFPNRILHMKREDRVRVETRDRDRVEVFFAETNNTVSAQNNRRIFLIDLLDVNLMSAKKKTEENTSFDLSPSWHDIAEREREREREESEEF